MTIENDISKHWEIPECSKCESRDIQITAYLKIIKSKLAFGIAGKAWAAINENDEIIEIISMEAYPYFTGSCKEVLERCNRKRLCKTSIITAESLNTESFLKHREESRKRLGSIPGCTVISGTASAGEFTIEYSLEKENLFGSMMSQQENFDTVVMENVRRTHNRLKSIG